MSEPTDTNTGMGSSDFERWGSEVENPAPPRPGPSRRALPNVSVTGLAVLAVVVAALVALIVHLASGGSGRPAGRASSHRAVAAAINLRVSDLSGFHRGPSGGVSVGGNPSGAFQQCLGSAVSALAAQGPAFSSPSFESGTGLHFVSLESTVTFTTPAALASAATAAADPRFPPCLANALAAMTYRAHGLAITSGGGAQASPLPLPPPRGRARTVLGTRATMTWSVNGINFPVFVDLYVVGLGHDQLSLFALSTVQPYSVATEDRLVALLESRARQQPH